MFKSPIGLFSLGLGFLSPIRASTLVRTIYTLHSTCNEGDDGIFDKTLFRFLHENMCVCK